MADILNVVKITTKKEKIHKEIAIKVSIKIIIRSLVSQGSLQVWSLMGGTVQKSDVRRLGIPADSDGLIPRQLGLIFVMDHDNSDFMFQQGL